MKRETNKKKSHQECRIENRCVWKTYAFGTNSLKNFNYKVYHKSNDFETHTFKLIYQRTYQIYIKTTAPTMC